MNGATRAAMFSSATDMWATPQDLFDRLDAEFHFTTDVCALPENAKCANYFTPEVDGLAQDWTGTCWMNPPYGREIGRWVRKAHDAAASGKATVVCLLPARTDTAWFHDYVLRGWGTSIHTRPLEVRRRQERGPLPFHNRHFQGPRPSPVKAGTTPSGVRRSQPKTKGVLTI